MIPEKSERRKGVEKMTREEILNELTICIRRTNELFEQLIAVEEQQVLQQPEISTPTILTTEKFVVKSEIIPVQQVTVEEMASKILKELGMPINIGGYRYIKKAVELVINDPTYFNGMITKRLYPDIAKIFETKAGRVERSIRHSIETTWQKGSIEKEKEIFGYTSASQRGNPSNSEFIAILVEKVKTEIKKRN